MQERETHGKRLSARWQELFWALPLGEMRHKLRALEIDMMAAIRVTPPVPLPTQEREQIASELLRKVRFALGASQSRIYPDVSYEHYLDSITGSLVELVEDGATEGDEHRAAAIRQAVEAIGNLRRTREQLRKDLERVALACPAWESE